jgi:DNA-directed RNA polymerase alpha subunit
LENREREINEKSLLIDELKRELAEIKINPYEMLDEARRKKQSENIHAVLKPKQYELFKILSQGEKGYEEILETVQSKNLDIRDMAALRLQISRLDKKLKQDTIYKIERIRRNKALYFRINEVYAKDS